MRSVLFRILLLLIFAAIPATLSGAYYRVFPSTPPQQLSEGAVLLENIVDQTDILWVDARSAEAYASGHIPTAHHIHLGMDQEEWDWAVMTLMEQIQPQTVIMVYCNGGPCTASSEVAQRLREEMGFLMVYRLHDGWQAWTASGRSIASGNQK